MITFCVIDIKMMMNPKSIICYIAISICMWSENIYSACAAHTALSAGTSIWKLADDLLSAHGANTVIYSSDIPYTIPGPGAYAVGNTLVATDSAPVITNNHPNVTINLKGHSIIGGSSSTAGIFVGPSGSVRILNGIISGFTAPASGIMLNTSQGTLIEDIAFVNTDIAITATSMITGLSIENCYFVSTATAVSLNAMQDVLINNCQDMGNLLINALNSSNITINNIIKLSGSGLATFNGVTNSKINGGYFVSLNAALTLMNSAYNVVSDCTWMNVVGNVISITGSSSTGNFFKNVNIHGTSANAVNIESGVTGTRFKSCSIVATLQ